MGSQAGWPEALWMVRHAESVGNAARTAAQEAGESAFELPSRDADIPLSERGIEQARALGGWFGRELAPSPPSVVLVSPYLRTRQTAEQLVAAAGWARREEPDLAQVAERQKVPAGDTGRQVAIPFVADERLREKDPGRLEGLTRKGIIANFPVEAEAYDRIGKFYYRPPGGESWCDVVLRLRSLIEAMRAEYADGRVLIVAHQVIVVCLRYVLEGLDEARVLDLERPGEVANASVTSYRRVDGRLVLERFNTVAPLEAGGAPITAEPPANRRVTGVDSPAGVSRSMSAPGDAAQSVPSSSTDGVPGERSGATDGRRGDRAQLVTPEFLAGWPLPAHHAESDKDDRGRVLIIGGDARVPGGAMLAAEAALRAGAGRVQLAVAAPVAAAVGVAIPESLVVAFPADADGALDLAGLAAIEERCRQAAAIVVGPGLIEPAASAALVRRIAGWVGDGALVVDAAALAGVDDESVRHLCGRVVLTPNAVEMGHLLDRAPEVIAEDPDCAARAAAARFGAVVAFKGRETQIAAPDGRLFRSRTGNVGLAISGSGDVLAGIVGGLLARGAEPVQAVVWAVHLHGLAGDRLAEKVGPLGYLPRELPGQLPALLATVAERREGA